MTITTARRTPSAAISPHRVGQVRRPVAVAPVDRQVQPDLVERRPQRLQQRPVLVVDRAAAAERVVVLADLLQPLVRDPAAAGHVLQEGQHVVGLLGATEGEQQDGVVRGWQAGDIGIFEASQTRTMPGPPGARVAGLSCSSLTFTSCAAAERPSFFAAGILGRMPISMIGLGIVILIAQESGSYGLAGAVSGVAVIAGALTGPIQGRLVDRFGQRGLILIGSVACTVGLAALLLAVRADAPTWVLYVAVVHCRWHPSTGRFVRPSPLDAPAGPWTSTADGVRAGGSRRRGGLHRRPGARHHARDAGQARTPL